jgi:hypothetical protein
MSLQSFFSEVTKAFRNELFQRRSNMRPDFDNFLFALEEEEKQLGPNGMTEVYGSSTLSPPNQPSV